MRNALWTGFLVIFMLCGGQAEEDLLQRPPLDLKADALHILIRHTDSLPMQGAGPVARSAEEAEALAASLLKRIRGGEMTFEQGVKSHSEGPEREDGGRIGSFDPDAMVPDEFKEVIFGLRLGEISEPLSTPFGVSLFKRIPVEEIPLAHIFITWSGTEYGHLLSQERSKEEAKALIEDVRAKLEDDASNWREITLAHSEDNLKVTGGVLGWISKEAIFPDLREAAFSLESGGISGVIELANGFHILHHLGDEEYTAWETWVNEEVSGQALVIRWTGAEGEAREDRPGSRTEEDAFSLTKELRAKAESGIAFGDLVAEYTEVPDEGKGHLGILTRRSGLDSAVLEALFSLENDALSQPIRTSEGYYLVVRRAVVKYRASHILVGFKTSKTPIPPGEHRSREDAKKRIDEARAKIVGGELSFEEAALRYSDDPNAQNGGDLGEFGRGTMVPPFEKALSSLEAGGLSDVVETDFGFHLIKRTR
jgi:parvulin-like peptidyl-prolyl isomerase